MPLPVTATDPSSKGRRTKRQEADIPVQRTVAAHARFFSLIQNPAVTSRKVCFPPTPKKGAKIVAIGFHELSLPRPAWEKQQDLAPTDLR